MVRLGLGVDGDTFVADISDITVVVISGVGDGLDTTIGKSNLVRSSDDFAISGLLSVEFGSGVVIGNTVLESIRLGGFIDGFAMRSRVVGSIALGALRHVNHNQKNDRGLNYDSTCACLTVCSSTCMLSV